MSRTANSPRGNSNRAHDRRGARRHEHFEKIVVHSEWADVGAALLDLSSTGGQVRIVDGLLPFEGDEVTLRLVDARHVSGRVIWIEDASVGIAFDQPIADVEELLWAEQRGPDWYRRATRPQA